MINKELLNLKLKGIETLECSLKRPQTPLLPNSIFGFEVKLEQRGNIEKNISIITINVNIIENDKKEKLGHYKANCIYEIEDLKRYFDKDKNIIVYPEQMSFMLNSISLSTIRGLMFGEFKGTFLHGAVLPIIDPKSLTIRTI